MKTLRFRGYGDDTFGEYNVTGIDVDNCASGKPIQCIVKAEGRAVIITGQYDRLNNGCWDIGVSLFDEEIMAPDWAMRILFEDYSTVLEIDVPDDVTLAWYNDGKKVEED